MTPRKPTPKRARKPEGNGYSEGVLIEQPAMDLFESMGWDTYNAYHEFETTGGSPLGRETMGEVVLTKRLRAALQGLNPGAGEPAVQQAIDQITADRSRMSAAEANREVYRLLKEGVRVNLPRPDGEGDDTELLRVIDWDNAKSNDYLACNQLWIAGEMYTRRADIVGFVNGLPLVFVELKAAHKRLETAYRNNLRDYRDTIPHVFWANGIIVVSNGSQSRFGSATASWEHFGEWKKVNSEKELGVVSLETMLRGTCEPTRLLDIVENYTVFMEAPGGLVKVVAKNHQYLGVTSAITALRSIEGRAQRLGVFWHTQGSGKSLSMVFFAQKVLRKVAGNWTFVVVTDRTELDNQIAKTFKSTGAITEGRAQAESSRHLRQLLAEDHRYVFTLIQKFRTENGEKHPVLSERKDIIVITDEAHRTQYDTLALNMRAALPKASFLAFTGTPLIAGEEKTRKVFGEYISVYDFKQSVQDEATVPLFYENRIPELQLTNQDLNQDMERLLEEAELDPDQERKLEREFSREYHLITRDERLDAVAADIVEHFTGRGFQGKAMVVCIDKATAVRMFDKVRASWQRKLASLQANAPKAEPEERDARQAMVDDMQSTDMAVVVSQSQNEIADMRAKGLDIQTHRRRMVKEDLDTKFKDPQDRLKLVFVCAMWMTGFDVPSCSTLYLDKPMRNHTLMQTIARANRVYEGKKTGLIVDYVGVFRNLEKALAIYGTGGTAGGERPVEPKRELVKQLSSSLAAAARFCTKQGVELDPICSASGLPRVKLLDNAVDCLVATDEVKKGFLGLSADAVRLYKAVLPDSKADQFRPICRLLGILADKIRALRDSVDISGVMEQVSALLDRSIAPEEYLIPQPTPDKRVDLSSIDFEALAKKFQAGHRHSEAERLRSAIAAKLTRMVRLNRSRMDFLAKFQKMIDEYNAGSVNVEEHFRRLTAFARGLNEEDQRAIGEQLSEEELAVFDLLTKPEMKLSAKDQRKVKQTARELLETLKREKLVLDWRKRQQARADVRVTIEKMLDAGLPEAYSRALFAAKSEALFQHVYECYFGAGRSVYSAAA